MQAGQAYSFTPTAHDPDGDALSFSIQNKPPWAAFSIATGQLSGTPSASNVGTYSGVVISVSDGKTAAALPSFAVVVSSPPAPPVTNGTATLTWVAPTQNTDGSPITGIAGYTIEYGTHQDALTQTVALAASATTYTVEGLAAGTWYFSVITDAISGAQSAPSSVVSKTIE